MKGELFDQQITFLYVKNLEQSRVFYEDIFRFPLILDQGSCRIVRSTIGQGGYLGYCLKNNNIQIAEGIILTLVTSSVDEWYVYLQSQGVDIPELPKINPDYDIYHFFLIDPDGYTIEIQQFLGEAWEKGITSA